MLLGLGSIETAPLIRRQPEWNSCPVEQWRGGITSVELKALLPPPLTRRGSCVRKLEREVQPEALLLKKENQAIVRNAAH